MNKNLLACTLIALAMGIVASCGEDPGMYRDETLTFTSPVSAKSDNATVEELSLDEENSSNFFFRRYGALVPWAPVPLFDYYLEPIPVEVPVSPFYSLIDYVHPFYAPYLFDDWYDDWDDDR
jgi:hypothetical protein